MSLSTLRNEQPVIQGQRSPMDREWFRWLRVLVDEVNRLSAKAWNAPTTEPLQLPSMTTAERDALTAVEGMVIYNSSNIAVEAYVGGAWGAL